MLFRVECILYTAILTFAAPSSRTIFSLIDLVFFFATFWAMTILVDFRFSHVGILS